jgi:hypothetical protein
MKYTPHLIVLLLLHIPLIAGANEGLELVEIPFVEGGGLEGIVTGLFYLSIVIAGMLAVVKLVIAGAKYMMSDVVTTKQSAIADIKGAIIGLLLVMGTVVILSTINADITNSNLELPSLGGWDDGALDGGGSGSGSSETEQIQETCEDIGGNGNCGVIPCDTIADPTMLLGVAGDVSSLATSFVTGNDLPTLDTCTARCGWVGGERTSSGDNCVYPNDSDTAAQNLINLRTEKILNQAEEPISDYNQGDSMKICSTQGGPTACDSTEEACTSGKMSGDGQNGNASNTTIDGVGRVVICKF